MKYIVETDLPNPHAAEAAMGTLPEITQNIFRSFVDLFPDQTEFKRQLHTVLKASSWDDAVSLMSSLRTPEAGVALSWEKHLRNERKGYLQLSNLGRADHTRFVEFTSQRGLPDAQYTASMLSLYIAAHHKQGEIAKDGFERHLKSGMHAPFVEFMHPERYSQAFVPGGIMYALQGVDSRIVVPVLSHGMAVILTHRKSDMAAVVLCPNYIDDDQVHKLKQHNLIGAVDACIVRGSRALQSDFAVQELKTRVVNKRGSISEWVVPSSQYALAVDIDAQELVADFADSPEWMAVDMGKLPHSS